MSRGVQQLRGAKEKRKAQGPADADAGKAKRAKHSAPGKEKRKASTDAGAGKAKRAKHLVAEDLEEDLMETIPSESENNSDEEQMEIDPDDDEDSSMYQSDTERTLAHVMQIAESSPLSGNFSIPRAAFHRAVRDAFDSVKAQEVEMLTKVYKDQVDLSDGFVESLIEGKASRMSNQAKIALQDAAEQFLANILERTGKTAMFVGKMKDQMRIEDFMSVIYHHEPAIWFALRNFSRSKKKRTYNWVTKEANAYALAFDADLLENPDTLTTLNNTLRELQRERLKAKRQLEEKKTSEETPAVAEEKTSEETPAVAEKKTSEETPAVAEKKTSEETPAVAEKTSEGTTPIAEESNLEYKDVEDLFEGILPTQSPPTTTPTPTPTTTPDFGDPNELNINDVNYGIYLDKRFGFHHGIDQR